MTKTSRGQGIRCGQCGGTFPLTTLAAAVACPYCGARQELAGGAFDQVREYRAEVFAEMSAADGERRQADGWERWRSGGAGPTLMLAVVGLAMVAPMCLSVPTYFLHLGHVHVPPALEGVLGVASSVGTLVIVVGGMGAAALLSNRRASPGRRSSAGAQTARVACPHCGAPSQIEPGQAVRTCGHCGGALMPSKTIMVRALDGVRAAKRRAMLDRYAAEREGMLGVQAYTRRHMRLVPLFYVIPFAPMAFGALALPLTAAHGEVSLARAMLIFVPILLVAGVLAGMGTFFVVRWRQRRRALEDALSDLAVQFHGRSSLDPADFVRWLGAHWAGPYDLNLIGAGPSYGTVAVDAWGYAAAVAMNPTEERFAQPRSPTYVRIALAAWVPSRSEGGPPPPLDARAQATMEWLRASGFAIRCEEAGILATAMPEVVARLAASPHAAHQLAPVIGHLARLAHEIGAQPVGPA